jgi:acetoin utilization deacetylase AcuC-like enzyme
MAKERYHPRGKRGNMRNSPGSMKEKPKINLVDDPAFDRHIPLAYHPERPERLTAARAALGAVDAEWARVATQTASREDLERVHDPRFIEELLALAGRSEMIDPDTYVSEESVDAAMKAAGSVVAMVDAMLDGSVTTGVAVVRPPGHHARPDSPMGFCLLNNIGIAAGHARARGLGRVAVVDFDVHHGNGTQEMFWTDPNVLYVSLHQWPFYPGSGAVSEVGEGEGTGYTINVPLSAGGGDAVYRDAFERIVMPVLEQYAPELVLVSAGFDAAARDPLAEMRLTPPTFGFMTKLLAQQAARSAKGRIALVLEGGYDLTSVELGLGASIRGMLGLDAFDVPPLSLPPPANETDLIRAAKVAARSWKL